MLVALVFNELQMRINIIIKYPNNAPSASFTLRLRQPENHRIKSYPQVIHRFGSKLSTLAPVGLILRLSFCQFVMLSLILT